MKTFQWTQASSVEQAIGQLDGQAVLKAGGVDLLDLMKEHLLEPAGLVNIRNIPGLDQIEDDVTSGL
ncbi:MAG TPA: FAD binding domain-containing protein [Gemmataceae bacterium]|nr:FAD binding domain-containing protein [Gemmataceae bacterium]